MGAPRCQYRYGNITTEPLVPRRIRGGVRRGVSGMGSASQSRIACGLTLASRLVEMSTLPRALKFRHVGTSTMPTNCCFLLSLRLQSSWVSRLFTLWFKNPSENEYFFPDSDFHPLKTARSQRKRRGVEGSRARWGGNLKLEPSRWEPAR